MVQCKTKMCEDWYHDNCIDTPIKAGKNDTVIIIRSNSKTIAGYCYT